jgi:mRNA interferase RelE/StbE
VAGYRLLIKPSAGKEIEALDQKKDRQRIVKRIAALASEPRPVGCEKLAGAEERYRVRQGQFRIVYAVDDATRTVEIVKVGHRREVYRGATRGTRP